MIVIQVLVQDIAFAISTYALQCVLEDCQKDHFYLR